MRHREEIDQQRANVLKSVRALVRLRHSILADEELNEVLPKVQAKFDAAAQRGQLLSVNEVRRSLGI